MAKWKVTIEMEVEARGKVDALETALEKIYKYLDDRMNFKIYKPPFKWEAKEMGCDGRG